MRNKPLAIESMVGMFQHVRNDFRIFHYSGKEPLIICFYRDLSVARASTNLTSLHPDGSVGPVYFGKDITNTKFYVVNFSGSKTLDMLIFYERHLGLL